MEIISETICLSFEHFDLVVELFQRSCGYTVPEVGKETLAMAIHGIGQFGETLCAIMSETPTP